MGFACVDVNNKVPLFTQKYKDKRVLLNKLAEENSVSAQYASMILAADCLILNSLPFFSKNRKYTLNNELGIKHAFPSHITGRGGFDLVWFNGYEYNKIDWIVCNLGLPIIIMYDWKKEVFLNEIRDELQGSMSAHTSIPHVYYSKVNNTYVCHISDLHKTLEHIGITPSHNILMAVRNAASTKILNTLKDYHVKPHTKKIEIS